MAVWPVTITQYPLIGTLTITPEPNVAEFKPDVGSPIRRKRYTAKRYIISADMLLQGAQRLTLDDFFTTDCEDGALTFTMTDWVLGTTKTFEWLSPPSFIHMFELNYRVSLQLARLPI